MAGSRVGSPAKGETTPEGDEIDGDPLEARFRVLEKKAGMRIKID